MVKLGSIIIQVRGVSYSPNDLRDSLNDESVILLRANNIQDGEINFDDVVYIDKKKVNKNQYLRRGDILICTSSGSKKLVGKAAYCTENINITFGTFCKVIRPSIQCKEFIGHFFNSSYYRRKISSLSSGANINNIRNEHIDNLEINLPDENIQETISQKLNLLNKITELRQTQLSKLDQLVKSRFIEMFGDLKNNTPSWDIVKLHSIIKSCDAGWSGSGTQRERQDNEIAVLKVSAVTKGYFDAYEYKVLNDQKNIKKYISPQKGDLIFSRANTKELVGATAIIDKDYPQLILPDKLWRIKFHNNINTYYIKYVLSDESYRKKISSISTGTSGSMFNVSIEKFKSMDIPLPPLPLQEQFAAFVQQIDKVKSSIKQSLEKLETLKKSLMQEYFG